jgi:LuxR family maltose regulon positive regulatory protein
MAESLLSTKLYIPNIPSGFVYRPALAKKMDLALEKRLCLISTPAGYGKTTLIGSWAKQREHPLAWISLDEGDNNFVRFFTYLVNAIQTAVKEFGQGLLGRLTSSHGMPHDQIMILLINALNQIDRDCVIVLEDFHVINKQEIHESVLYLLENLPPKVHFIISSRAELPFSVANLRTKAQLVEIRYPELCFSEREASYYLNQKMGLKLTEKEIQTLVEYTEGWIAGLYLAAVSLADTDKTSSFISHLGSTNRYIAGYLFDEVLRRQPKEIQSFLLRSSVLDRFTESLCDTALNIETSHTLIASLEQANLFILPLDSQQEWYRYHHKFSEMLYDRLKRTNSSQIGDICGRASLWFEEQGLLDDAIEYAIRAQNYSRAAELVERIGGILLWTGNVGQLLDWLEKFPAEIYYQNPGLWLLHLWSHINLAQFSIVADDLEGDRLKTILAHILDRNEKKNFECGLAIVHAITTINWEYDIIAGRRYAELGIQNQGENGLTDTMALVVYGKACMLSGDLEMAKGLLVRSLARFEKAGSVFMQMVVIHHLSELAYFEGDMHRMEDLLKEAYRYGIDHHLDNTSAFFRVCIDLGRLHYEKDNLTASRQFLAAGVRGGERFLIAYDILDGYCALFDLMCRAHRMDAAEQVISSVEALCKSCGYPPAILERAEAMRIRVAISKNDSRAQQRWVEKVKLQIEKGFLFQQKYEAQTAVQTLVALKQLNLAKNLVQKLILISEESRLLKEITHYKTWLASILYQQGNLQAALVPLREAVAIGLHQGYIHTIVDVDAIPDLLDKLLSDTQAEENTDDVIKEYLLTLIEASQGLVEAESIAWSDWPNIGLLEPLTDREIKVLELLITGDSNQEIAEMIVVTQSTVKYHLKNIYLKLGVHTRMEAVVRAKQLGLV